MPKNLYIGDWHYGHKNIPAIDNRPFRDLGEMHQALVDRWNHAVDPGDTVYVLGDMFWPSGAYASDSVNVLKRLNGHKVMILGNHDQIDANEEACFQSVHDYLEVLDGDDHVILSHYPNMAFRNYLVPGWAHLYAHVHDSFSWHVVEHAKDDLEALYQRPVRMYNAGCMMPWMGYTPRTFKEIEAGYKIWKKAHKAGVNHVETSRMLTLSTAHITKATADALDNAQESNEMPLAVYNKSGSAGEDFGWYVYLPDKISHKGFEKFPDLLRIMDRAHALGCQIVCLDCDGPEVPGLEVFSW